MNEDNTTIKFSLPESEQAKLDSFLKFVGKQTQKNGNCEIDTSRNAEELTITINNASFSEANLEAILLRLHQSGANNIVCTTWLDDVGEAPVSAIVDGKCLTFESLQALRDYRQETEQPATAEFDYGKARNNKTALIRLQIKAKGKRQQIAELFSNAHTLNPENTPPSFSANFKKLVKSSQHDVKWCAFKWKEDKRWWEGPAIIINGLIFVREEDGFLYLGFDLEPLDWNCEDSDLEHLIFVLSCLDGVSKTWIKVRPGANTIKERYIYHPGMGDEPMVLRKPLTEDNEWPRY